MQENGQTNYMSQRRQMQVQARVGKRYTSAISNELSKKIKAGNYKHMTLKNVIADPKFQDSGFYGSNRYNDNSASDLMDMILDLPTSENPYESRFASQNSSLINEN